MGGSRSLLIRPGIAVALEIALRSPALVCKLVWAGGTSYRRDGLTPRPHSHLAENGRCVKTLLRYASH